MASLPIFSKHNKVQMNKTRSKSAPKPKGRKQSKLREDKEVLRLISHDMIRELVVPSSEPNLYPAIIRRSDLERIKEEAKVLSNEQKAAVAEEKEQLRNQQVRECEERKKNIQKWEKKRLIKSRQNYMEEDATKQVSHLLQRALELQLEQEDDVKTANQLVLSTKCHTIRDAQVQEKELMRKELEEEDLRLDRMMEEERIRAVKKEESLKEKKLLERYEYVKKIIQQMKENEMEKLREAERIDEESEMLCAIRHQIEKKEQEDKKKKAEEQEAIRRGLNEVNKQLLNIQEKERIDMQNAELKIQEYMWQKSQREKALADEKKKIHLAKEREIARLRALQQRQQDMQDKMDQVNARRIQDEVERVWRRKELEAVRKKAKEDEELKKARMQQVMNRQRMQTLEISRERRDLEKVMHIQMEEAEVVKQEQIKRQKETEAHREAILNQIKEKQLERAQCRKKVNEEGDRMKQEQSLHEHRIKECILKKIKNLRVHKVPECYVKEVERQLKIK